LRLCFAGFCHIINSSRVRSLQQDCPRVVALLRKVGASRPPARRRLQHHVVLAAHEDQPQAKIAGPDQGPPNAQRPRHRKSSLFDSCPAEGRVGLDTTQVRWPVSTCSFIQEVVCRARCGIGAPPPRRGNGFCERIDRMGLRRGVCEAEKSDALVREGFQLGVPPPRPVFDGPPRVR